MECPVPAAYTRPSPRTTSSRVPATVSRTSAFSRSILARWWRLSSPTPAAESEPPGGRGPAGGSVDVGSHLLHQSRRGGLVGRRPQLVGQTLGQPQGQRTQQSHVLVAVGRTER